MPRRCCDLKYELQIVDLYEPSRCDISCCVFLAAVGKVLSMMALCMFTSLLVSCSRVSCSDNLTVSSAAHVAKRCSSPSLFVLQKGQCLRVGLMGVIL